MTTIVNGKDVSHLMIGNREAATGDAVWIDSGNDSLSEENLVFIEEIQNSAVGEKFLARGFKFGANFDLIAATVYKLDPYAPLLTTGRMLSAMTTLMVGAPDKLIAKEVPAATPAAPSPAVDKNGRVLSDSQKAWSEYRIFSETHSMRDVRERMRIDPGYASFVNTNRQREFQTVGDSLVPTNQHLLPKQELSDDAIRGAAAKASLLLPQLEAWVIEYNKTPAARVRALRSAASNPIGYEQYEKSFQAAISAGLI